jgi:amidohydrolase
MLDDGLLEIANPDVAYMLHVWHELPAGRLAVRKGPVMAGALRFAVTLNGRGGHAARPHQALDPVVVAAQLVTVLQTLVSRESDPAEPVVLTIGSIQAGTAANVIPDTAYIQGTARAYERGILGQLQQRIAEVATQVAAAMRVSADVTFADVLPPVVNDAAAAAGAQESIRRTLGDGAIGEVAPSMGSEDFAHILEHVPGAMIRLGVRAPEWADPRPIHTATFDLDERSLRVGVAAMSSIAMDYRANSGRV